jgi:glycosyltransferase involved in cell wall biosynthesis
VLLIEAGYFGCPVISTRKFAAAEIVDDGRTGFLLEDPPNHQALAKAMCWMLEHHDEYRQMRAAAWAKARTLHSWKRFAECLCSCVIPKVSFSNTELASSR